MEENKNRIERNGNSIQYHAFRGVAAATTTTTTATATATTQMCLRAEDVQKMHHGQNDLQACTISDEHPSHLNLICLLYCEDITSICACESWRAAVYPQVYD